VILFPSSFGVVGVDLASPEPAINYHIHSLLPETLDAKARAYTRYSVPLSAASAQPPAMPPMMAPDEGPVIETPVDSEASIAQGTGASA
jgi:hypothetical protein